jgi:predicted MPP superfamily phosphohydrolase
MAIVNSSSPVEYAPPVDSTPQSRAKPVFLLYPFYNLWRRMLDEIEVVRLDLPVRGLAPAHRGLRACQLSDLHVDRDEDLERVEQAVNRVNDERPALVFLTGDYFSEPPAMRRYLVPLARALGHLRPTMEAFAVPGNHDNWCSFAPIAEHLAKAGVRPLRNQHRRIVYNGHSLVVVGIDDLMTRRADPNGAFRGIRPDECTIVLAHHPDTALYLRHLRPGVMLSGHTHGGAIRIPLLSNFLPSILQLGPKYYAGLNPFEDFHVYTNRGLGNFCIRVRINCRPEVSSFTLTTFEPSTARKPVSLI